MKTIFSKASYWLTFVAMAAVCFGCADADSRKQSYLERGQQYFDQQNYDKASVEVRNALQIDPKFVAARFLAGRVAEKKSELREAVGHYQAALDEDPKFNPARAAMARLFLLGGLPDRALELVETGLADDPQNSALLTVRGAARARGGDIAGALADTQASARIAPDNEDTIALLASLYKQSGSVDKAIEIVNAGLERSPKSVDLRLVLTDLKAGRQDFAGVESELKQIIEIDPKTLVHRARLAQFYLYRKDIAAAEATLRSAIAAQPDELSAKLALVDLLWSQRDEETATREMETLVIAEPRNAKLKLALAGYFERQNKLDRAAETYQDVVRDEGTDADGLTARNRLAALAVKQNNPERAGTLVAEVLKENPRDNDALVIRANLALVRGETTTAITDLRAVLRDQPNSVPLLRALAQAHLQNNELALAEETLRSAVQANPGDVPARKDLAQLLLRDNKADQALALLEPMSTAPATAADVAVWDDLFKAKMVTKDFAAAAQAAAKIQELQPKTALGSYYAGLAAEAQQDVAGARRSYERALELQPNVVEPLSSLVRLDLADKNSERALERVAKVIAENPQNAVALNMQGELQLGGKQLQAAADSFKKSTEIAPDWWMPYRGLGMAQLAQEQPAAAVATFQAGIDRTKNAALSAQLAAIHERMGNTDQAIQVYEQWVAREPKSMVAVNNLAVLIMNYRADAASLQRASQLTEPLAASQEPALLDTRGWLKYKTGDFVAALPLLQQAAASSKNSAEILYHLGMTQWRTGDKTGARQNLQGALGAGRPFFGMDEAKNTLDSLKETG